MRVEDAPAKRQERYRDEGAREASRAQRPDCKHCCLDFYFGERGTGDDAFELGTQVVDDDREEFDWQVGLVTGAEAPEGSQENHCSCHAD